MRNASLAFFVLMCLPVASVLAADKCAAKPATACAAAEEGFVSIFNGKNLDGWIGLSGNKNDHYVKDGMLIVKDTAHDHLFTEKEYANFIFRFEIKLDTGSNNGIGIRDKITKIPHLEGNELQVLDDSYFPCVKHGRKLELKEYQYHGSLYGVVPAKRGHLKPVGEWNQEEIICDGRKLKVILNGTAIVDVDLDKVKPIDGHDKEHAGLKYEKGHIGLHAHGNYGAEVFFRNLRVKELK